MTRDQRVVAIGAASGVLSMLIGVAVIYHFWPVPPGLSDAGSRLSYALRLEPFALLPLLAGIVAVGNARALSPAIDPTLHKDSPAMEIDGRVVDNTVQQTVLFVVATLALSVAVGGPEMRAIPAAIIVFVVARAAFWIGYRIHPLYRALGMAATMYLNVGLIGFALWRAVRGA